MLYGWTGKRLVVDLTRSRSWVESIPERWRQEYIGGRGVNSRTLYDEVGPGIDPLGPENVLLFGVGPTNGTGPGLGAVHGYGSLAINARRRWTLPLLRGLEFRRVLGGPRNPSTSSSAIPESRYVPRRVSGAGTPGKPMPPSGRKPGNRWLKSPASGRRGKTWCATLIIINNLSRAAGKCGMGAVMGSKNLKAVAVRGTRPVTVADPARLKDVATRAMEVLENDPSAQVYAAYGTSSLLAIHQRLGRLATRN